jgi:hypothetical protein
MKERVWRPIPGLCLIVLLAACSNGGKNLRDTTGMTPGSAAGQLGGASAAAAPGAPGTMADSITSRRDTLGDRLRRTTADTSRRRP